MFRLDDWDSELCLDDDDISFIMHSERKYPCEASSPAMALMKNLAERLSLQTEDRKTQMSALLAINAIGNLFLGLPLEGPNLVLPTLMAPIERVPELWDRVEARCSSLPDKLRKHARVMHAVARRQRLCFMFASTYLIIALTQLPELTISDLDHDPGPDADEDEDEDEGPTPWDGVRTNERELRRLTQIFEWGLQSMYSDLFLEDDHRWERYREELELAYAEDEKRQAERDSRKRKAEESNNDEGRAPVSCKVLRMDSSGNVFARAGYNYYSSGLLQLSCDRIEVSITGLPIGMHTLKVLSEAIREDGLMLGDGSCDSLLSTKMPCDSLATNKPGDVENETLHLRGNRVKGDWREGIGDWGPEKYLPLEVLIRSTKQIAIVAKRIGIMSRRERGRRIVDRQTNAEA